MKSNSVNFRNFDGRGLFNEDARRVMLKIYNLFHNEDSRKNNESLKNDLHDLLSKLKKCFENFYVEEKKDKYSKEKAIIRSKEMHSEFLQSLIYYIAHNVKDKLYQEKLTLIVAEYPDLFYVNPDNEVTIWIDPKENFSALSSAARSGLGKGAMIIIQSIIIACDSDIKKLHDYLSIEDIHGFTALNAAAREGHLEAVQTLLIFAETIYADNKKLLFAFLMHENRRNFTALNAAALGGHLEVVKVLIRFAKENFSEDSALLTQFIEQKNNAGFTSLNAVCNAAAKTEDNSRYEQIALRLLYEHASPIEKNNSGLTAHENAPKNWDWFETVVEYKLYARNKVSFFNSAPLSQVNADLKERDIKRTRYA